MQPHTYTFQDLPLDLLECDPEHPRHLVEGFDAHHPLLVSLRAYGMEEAIPVCPTQAGTYLVIDGNRRLRCARKLRWQTVPCQVFSRLSRAEIHVLRYILQNSHKPWTAQERKQAQQRLEMLLEQKVMAQAERTVAAARQFAATAQDLMQRLAEHLNAPLEALAADPLAGRAYPSSGPLDPDWQYVFHGFECGFENESSGQIVEVPLGFAGEFGVLDPYFFAEFIRSTPAFENLISLFNDGNIAMRQALEILEKQGEMQRIRDRAHGRIGWIAKTA